MKRILCATGLLFAAMAVTPLVAQSSKPTSPVPPQSTPPTFPQSQAPTAPLPPDTAAPPATSDPSAQHKIPSTKPDDQDKPPLPQSDAPRVDPEQRAISSDVQTEVQKKLDTEPTLAGDKITVTVDDDAVTLSGDVSNREHQEIAERVAQSYAGKRKLVDKLKLRG